MTEASVDVELFVGTVVIKTLGETNIPQTVEDKDELMMWNTTTCEVVSIPGTVLA